MVSDPSSVTVGIDAAVVAKHRVVVRGSGGVEDRFWSEGAFRRSALPSRTPERPSHGRGHWFDQ